MTATGRTTTISLTDDRTIYDVLRDTVQQFGERSALGTKRGDGYAYLTYRELWDEVRAFRRGLVALGVRAGDRVALLSENRTEWAIADLAVQALGGVTVAIYPTLPTEQVQYLVADSAARVLIVSDAKQLAKALELKPQVRSLERIVVMDGVAPEGVLRFCDVGAACEAAERPELTDAALDEQARSVSADDVATLIYTSGTTGDPKGAMLSHRALLHSGRAALQVVELNETDVFLSFLPLSHVIERVGGYYLPLMLGACIVYSEGVFAIGNELPAVRPTVFLCVPRLYASVQEKILDGIRRLPARRRRLAEWAVRAGREAAERTAAGRRIGPLLAIRRVLADQLVLRAIREKATGGRTRFLVTGGAPLPADTGAFFEGLGICLLEGYGLTECPVITLNRPASRKLGTVGPPLPGMEVKIAADGEILARGPSLMRGYFGHPQATEEAIDPAGWFHTGDIGELTGDGFLRITDRKKDIIVLANGKNVAPQPIEAKLKESAFIGEIVLIGDRQSAIVAIVVPAFDRLKAWAKQHGIPASNSAELARRAEVRKLLKDEIERLSGSLADFERVKRFSVVDAPFTIEGGELTPTLKVKRRFVAQKYAPLIEQMAR